MKLARVGYFVSLMLAVAALAGCNKPSEDSCRKALSNMRHLLGTDKLTQVQSSVEGEVRRCRGGSSRKSVECAIRATSLDELRACKLVDLPAGAGAAAPSSAPPTESAPAAAPPSSAPPAK